MRQMERFASDGILCNAQMGPRQLEEHCRLDGDASKQLEEAIVDLGFSARAYERILKAAHSFNLLDARKAISVTERQRYILRIRTLTKAVAEAYYASREALGFPMCQRSENKQG